MPVTTVFLYHAYTILLFLNIPGKSSKISILFKLTCYRIPYRKNPYKSMFLSILWLKIKNFKFSK